MLIEEFHLGKNPKNSRKKNSVVIRKYTLLDVTEYRVTYRCEYTIVFLLNGENG